MENNPLPSPQALPAMHGAGCGCPHGGAAGQEPVPVSLSPPGSPRALALDANAERAAPADSTITQGSPSLLLNRKHFSVSFPLPLELKPPFCSKTHQAKEISSPFAARECPSLLHQQECPPCSPPHAPSTLCCWRDKWSPPLSSHWHLGDSRDRDTEGAAGFCSLHVQMDHKNIPKYGRRQSLPSAHLLWPSLRALHSLGLLQG